MQTVGLRVELVTMKQVFQKLQHCVLVALYAGYAAASVSFGEALGQSDFGAFAPLVTAALTVLGYGVHKLLSK